MPRAVRIIGVPLDLGAGRRGVDMGPSAIRVADVEPAIERLGIPVQDAGDLAVTVPETVAYGSKSLRFIEGVIAVNAQLAQAVQTALDQGFLPLVLGGDHSIAIGSLAGSSAHFASHGQRVGVVWLDAHGDMNTPETTPSGNIHGMCLAVSLGLGDARLVNLHRPGPKLDPRNVALVGIRDLDPGERENLHRAGVRVFTIRDVDERGMAAVMREAIAIASDGTSGIHLQLDMDVLDPEEAPGTGTPVWGGISYREAHLAMEMLADHGMLRVIDVVEINPILGQRNETAEVAVELITSALGKRII
ncbi:MAG: Arginase [Phycisphaerae bacterium]|nr:Arginase [Phycisphaerae bacterium]